MKGPQRPFGTLRGNLPLLEDDSFRDSRALTAKIRERAIGTLRQTVSAEKRPHRSDREKSYSSEHPVVALTRAQYGVPSVSGYRD